MMRPNDKKEKTMNALNSIQERLVSGSPQAGWTEGVADCFLALPAFMWREKNVKLIKDDFHELKVSYTAASIIMDLVTSKDAVEDERFIFACLIGVPVFSIGYAVSAIIAAPLLAVGLPLKEIALVTDPQALAYNNLAVKHLNDLEDMSEIDRSLQDGCMFAPYGHANKIRQERLKSLNQELQDKRASLKNEEAMLTFIENDMQNMSESKEQLDQKKLILFSTSSNSASPISKNQLQQNILLRQTAVTKIEDEILCINTQIKKLRELPEKFMSEARQLTMSETYTLI